MTTHTETVAQVKRADIVEWLRLDAIVRNLDSGARVWDSLTWRVTCDATSRIQQELRELGRDDVADALTVHHNLTYQLAGRDRELLTETRTRLAETYSALTGRTINKRRIRLSWWTR